MNFACSCTLWLDWLLVCFVLSTYGLVCFRFVGLLLDGGCLIWFVCLTVWCLLICVCLLVCVRCFVFGIALFIVVWGWFVCFLCVCLLCCFVFWFDFGVCCTLVCFCLTLCDLVFCGFVFGCCVSCEFVACFGLVWF